MRDEKRFVLLEQVHEEDAYRRGTTEAIVARTFLYRTCHRRETSTNKLFSFSTCHWTRPGLVW